MTTDFYLWLLTAIFLTGAIAWLAAALLLALGAVRLAAWAARAATRRARAAGRCTCGGDMETCTCGTGRPLTPPHTEVTR